jgi:hypothetical protein
MNHDVAGKNKANRPRRNINRSHFVKGILLGACIYSMLLVHLKEVTKKTKYSIKDYLIMMKGYWVSVCY